MGLVRMGPNPDLLSILNTRCGVRFFVETGTYRGDTAIWAASHFDRVVTIEYSQELYRQAIARRDRKVNIEFMFGDSRSLLRTIVPELDCPTIFWLDSHWSGGNTYGNDDECPLLQEIEAVNQSKHAPFILIDDARLFMSPPPRPHEFEQWPRIDEVVRALAAGEHEYYITAFEDEIIAVPKYAERLVASYMQDVNTKAWEGYGSQMSETDSARGRRLVSEGLHLMARAGRTRLRRLVPNRFRALIHHGAP